MLYGTGAITLRCRVIPACLIILATLLVPVAGYGADNSLREAEALVQAGKGARAYPLLAPLEAARAGDPHFDRLLGLAALAAGEAGHATLALERVVIVQPSNPRAHLDLARAYLALGDRERARAELGAALALNPPPAIEQAARQTLAGMQAPTALPRHANGIYAEVGLGYDSNVNIGPSQQVVYLPLFGVDVTLDNASLEQSDSYGQLALGGQYRHAIGADTVISASLDTQARRHFDVEDFDPLSALLRLGVGFHESRSPKRLTWFGQYYELGEDRDYLLHGLIGEWLLPMGRRNTVQLYGRYSQLRYGSSELEANDVNQSMLGAGWLYAVTPALFAGVSAYGGIETEANRRADGDSRILGLRATMQYTRRVVDVYGALGYQSNGYDRENILFRTKRGDGVIDLTLGAIYRLTPAWSLRPKITYMQQQSNIAVYDVERYDISLGVRYDFRFH